MSVFFAFIVSKYYEHSCGCKKCAAAFLVLLILLCVIALCQQDQAKKNNGLCAEFNDRKIFIFAAFADPYHFLDCNVMQKNTMNGVTMAKYVCIDHTIDAIRSSVYVCSCVRDHLLIDITI